MVIVVVGILLFVKWFILPNIEEKIIPVDAKIYDWAYNQDNDNEMFFDYLIYNYGDSEAKNVVVTCKLLDIDEKLTATAQSKERNIASNSYLFEEVITTRPPYVNDMKYSGVCYIESCDNCEILWRNIPALVEIYD